ncbi:MAG: hypothetical protein EA397_09660 [Deltaproteobacteria bacterium]|nr:MAG: hypothetical protein EA397_09660 [Deltaproteobacteria bacterium]
MVRFLVALSLLTLPSIASANCDHLVRKAATAKGDALISAYRSLIQCDKGAAEASYNDFLKQTGDVPTMVQLSLAAIDEQVYKPVWESLERIPYNVRDETATAIGETCLEHPQVVVFLKGAYFGLKSIQFSQWDDAFVSCPSDDIEGWVEGRIKDPPAFTFDEKYNTILSIWTARKGAEALPALKSAAITAAQKDGPFLPILEAMDRSVQPETYGQDPDPAHIGALRGALVEIAGGVDPNKARQVADRLFNAGAESEAASLLPKIFPDRVQSDGTMLYGVATIEACEDQVMLHVTEVTEPASRWSIQTDVETKARSVKSRLKCKADEPWPVVVSPEPFADSKAVSAWADELASQWEAQGKTVKSKSASKISLPPRK